MKKFLTILLSAVLVFGAINVNVPISYAHIGSPLKSFSGGYIIDAAVNNSSAFSTVAQIKLINGDETIIYDFKEKFYINGESFDTQNVTTDELQTKLIGSFCSLKLDSRGRIRHLMADSTPAEHLNASYSEITGRFDGVSRLPVVIYKDGTVYSENIVLKSSNVYTIDVYDYGIVVKDFAPREYKTMFTDIEVYEDRNFSTKSIIIGCNYIGEVAADDKICYSAKSRKTGTVTSGEPLSEQLDAPTDHIGFGISIPYDTDTYDVSLYVKGADGTEKSREHSFVCKTGTFSIEYGYVTNYGYNTDAFARGVAILLMQDGKENTYQFAKKFFINGVSYTEPDLTSTGGFGDSYDTSALDGIFKTNALCRYILNEEGEILRLDYDAEPTEHSSIGYNSSTGSFAGLDTKKVFMGEDFSDGQHLLNDTTLYTISEYDHGIILNDINPGDLPMVFTSVSGFIDPQFEANHLGIDFEYKSVNVSTNINISYKINGNGVNAAGTMSLADCKDIGLGTTVPYKGGTYDIEIYAVDNNGNKISEAISCEYTSYDVSLYYGYIEEYGENTSTFIPGIDLRIAHMGKTDVYKCADRVVVNGTRYTINNDDERTELAAILEKDTLCRFILDEEGKIDMLDFGTNGTAKQNVSYTIANGLEDFDRSKAVVYKNGRVYDSKLIVSSFGIYDVVCYNFGVLVTDFRPKDELSFIFESLNIEEDPSYFANAINLSGNILGTHEGDSYLKYSIENILGGTAAQGMKKSKDSFDIFGAIPQSSGGYSLTMQMVDSDGNELSEAVEFDYTSSDITSATGVSTDYVELYTDDDGNKTMYIEMLRTQAMGIALAAEDDIEADDAVMYKFADEFYVNGELYRTQELDSSWAEANLAENSSYMFVLDDNGDISKLSTVMEYPYYASIDENDVVTITAEIEAIDKTFIIAVYSDGTLMEAIPVKFDGSDITHEIKSAYDRVSVMLWDDMTAVYPLSVRKDLK